MAQEITFAQWLRSRRKVLDLTQQALADQISCSAEMIYRIEAGQRRPSVQIARLLGRVVNVPDNELDAFVAFARAQRPTQVHAHHVEVTPWRDAFIPRNNLPLQLTTLVGREKRLAEAADRLRRDGCRLLTFVGPPGIGKTRMAIQLGNDSLLNFPDGTYFVELASTVHGSRIVLEIARALDITLGNHERPETSLHKYLYERQTLLILDNFEQLLDAAPVVSAMLAACPLVKIVVTSRAPLRVRGEQQFPVEALALPERVDDLNFRALVGYSAVQLFAERARAVRPDFELTAQNAVAVATVCARLDGVPLAIEIVAVQVAIMDPDEIMQHLSGRSLLESWGTIDSDPRHHSLNEAIRWSFLNLDEREQTFCCRLGVFVGGFTLEAAQHVCQPDREVVLSLSKLANYSLLKREPAAAGESRFRMLEIIRQFGQQEMQTRDEWQTVRERHASYFYRFGLENENSVRTGGQVAGLERVERDHYNLQAALDYFIETESWRMGLELAGALVEFWVYHNHVLVGLSYATALLERTADNNDLEASRLHLLNGAAVMSYFAGDFRAVDPFAQQALEAAKRQNNDRDIAWASITLGMQSGGMGRFEAAIDYFEQARTASDPAALPWETSSLLNGLGEVARSQGNYDEALKFYAEALEISEGMGNLWLSAHVLDNIGHTAILQGRLKVARDYIRRSMQASVALGDERGIAMCLEKLGRIAIAQGSAEKAAKILGAAEALREAKNTPVEGMDSADYRHSVNLLNARLEPNVLRANWTDGRRLPLTQLISEILEG